MSGPYATSRTRRSTWGMTLAILVVTCGVLARTVRGEEPDRLAATLARIAAADEQGALRAFRSALAERERHGCDTPAGEAAVAAATFARLKTPSARATLLGEIRARSLAAAGPTVVVALGDADASVVEAAVHAVAALGLASAVDRVVELAVRAECPIRARVAWALGDLGARQSAGTLARLLIDPEAAVREEAASSLGWLRAGDHEAALVTVEPAKEPMVRAGSSDSTHTSG